MYLKGGAQVRAVAKLKDGSKGKKCLSFLCRSIGCRSWMFEAISSLFCLVKFGRYLKNAFVYIDFILYEKNKIKNNIQKSEIFPVININVGCLTCAQAIQLINIHVVLSPQWNLCGY